MPPIIVRGRQVPVRAGVFKAAQEQRDTTAEKFDRRTDNSQPPINRSDMAQPEFSAGEYAEDAAKSFGVGLARGAIGLAGTGGDVREGISGASNWLAKKLGASPERATWFADRVKEGLAVNPLLPLHGPTSDEITNLVRKATAPRPTITQLVTGEHPESFIDRKPRSTLGEYSQTLGEFAPAAVAGPGGVLRKAAMTVIPAALSETAGQIARATGHEDYEPWARLGVAVLGGGLTAGGKLNKVKRGANETLPSDGVEVFQDAPPRLRKIFDPPHKPQRAFEEDYSKRPAHDETGKLQEDIDGDPLGAQHVAGRLTLAGRDIGFNPKTFRKVVKALTNLELVPRKHIDGASGRTFVDRDTKEVQRVNLADDLNATRHNRVLGHEFGHVVHTKTGLKPISDAMMRAELERNYNALATGSEDSRKLTLPFDHNYRAAQNDEELIAEAVFAAFKNPNYMKTVAPVTYATLRQWIKSNPELAKVIQLNGLAAATAGAAGLGLIGQSNESRAGEASPPQPEAQTNVLKGRTAPGSYGKTKVTDALVKQALPPIASKPGKFGGIAQALLALKAGRKSPSLGGTR